MNKLNLDLTSSKCLNKTHYNSFKHCIEIYVKIFEEIKHITFLIQHLNIC